MKQLPLYIAIVAVIGLCVWLMGSGDSSSAPTDSSSSVPVQGESVLSPVSPAPGESRSPAGAGTPVPAEVIAAAEKASKGKAHTADTANTTYSAEEKKAARGRLEELLGPGKVNMPTSQVMMPLPEKIRGQRTELNFGQLTNFTFKEEDELPGEIQSLDGINVAIQGYALPFQGKGDAVKGFLLLKDQAACCFGQIPLVNEFVVVRVPDDLDLEVERDRPMWVMGTLKVKKTMSRGRTLDVYRLTAEKTYIPALPKGS